MSERPLKDLHNGTKFEPDQLMDDPKLAVPPKNLQEAAIQWMDRALDAEAKLGAKDAAVERIRLQAQEALRRQPADAVAACVAIISTTLEEEMHWEMHWEIYYGPFRGGDPTAFVPDDDCSTPEERAHHREDCRRWMFHGGYVDRGPQCEFVNPTPPSEQPAIGYGLGTGRYQVTHEEWLAMNEGNDEPFEEQG